MKAKFKYINTAGTPVEGEFQLEDYRRAKENGMTLTQLVNARYPDADTAKFGTAFEQGLQNTGIYTKAVPERGITVSKMGDMLDGTVLERRMAGEGLASGGGIVSPSTQGTTPASRLFFPEVVLNQMNEVLQDDYSLEEQVWSSMIGNKENIPTEMFTQPLINIEAPKAEDSAPISQNSLPKTLVSVTSSQYSKSIITNAVGLQISDQAIQNASIDLVGTIFAQQVRGESMRNMWSDIANIVSGNVDSGDAALTPDGFKATYDSAAAANSVTQKGWIKYLYDPSRTISIDSILCTIDTYLAIQGRAGRPVIFDANTTGTNAGNLGTYGLNVEPNLLNVSVGVPNVMIVPATAIAENVIVGFDSRFALRQVTNVNASYSATERMVLQRSNFFRVDWGRMTYRLFDSAFSVTDITNA